MRLNKKYLFTLSTVAILSATALIGCSSNKKSTDSTSSSVTTAAEESTGKFVDGTYKATADEADNGYTSFVTMEVKDGAITSMVWDATDDKGQSKKELADNGSYVMTEDGLKWSEQSDALCDFVVTNQTLDGLTTTDDEGHTDAVSGVSIKISAFLTLAQDCLDQAAAK